MAKRIIVLSDGTWETVGSGSPDEEYCDDCLNAYAVDGHADSYTRRMENGWTE